MPSRGNRATLRTKHRSGVGALRGLSPDTLREGTNMNNTQQAIASFTEVLDLFGAGRKEVAISRIKEQKLFEVVTPSQVIPFMRSGRTKRPLKEAVSVLYGAFLHVKHNIPVDEALVYGSTLGQGVEDCLAATDLRAALDSNVASVKEEAAIRKAKRVEAGKTVLPSLANAYKSLIAVREAVEAGAVMPVEAETVISSIFEEIAVLAAAGVIRIPAAA
jgi:hypothetical protein